MAILFIIGRVDSCQEKQWQRNSTQEDRGKENLEEIRFKTKIE